MDAGKARDIAGAARNASHAFVVELLERCLQDIKSRAELGFYNSLTFCNDHYDIEWAVEHVANELGKRGFRVSTKQRGLIDVRWDQG